MPLESHGRDIFAITGLAPEVQAVAFAKYSRSQESVKTTIDDLTDEKSAEFHEKWVLGYGDASVADMAIIAIALENVSMLASKAVEDHRLASYQEKSTRYVPFDPTRFHKPKFFLTNEGLKDIYTSSINRLMNGYTKILARMIDYFREKYPKPKEMADKAYENRLRARSLDVARYVLPVSTLTNFGLLASAREVRYMVSRLLAHPLQEIREVGEEIKRAALEPAYNPQEKKITPLLEKLAEFGAPEDVLNELRNAIKLTVQGAPTLIQFTEPREYLKKKDELASLAGLFLESSEPADNDEPEPRVEFISECAPEDELVASLLYPHSKLSFTEIIQKTKTLPSHAKQKLIRATQKERGVYDNLSREFEVGNHFIFDTLMDYGAFRDLQRHRLTSQLNQPVTPDHGFEIPRDLTEAGMLPFYKELLEQNKNDFNMLASAHEDEARYALAMAWRKRTLFKMNLRELYHVVELRSKSGGHFSYRELVYKMFELVREKHPMLVEHLRAVKMDFDADFFGR